MSRNKEYNTNLIAQGRVLKCLRKKAKFTQGSANSKVNKSATWLSDIERGRSDIMFDDCKNLVYRYGYTLEEFSNFVSEVLKKSDADSVISNEKIAKIIDQNHGSCKPPKMNEVKQIQGPRDLEQINHEFDVLYANLKRLGLYQFLCKTVLV